MIADLPRAGRRSPTRRDDNRAIAEVIDVGSL
jgi:hypothetical protein